MRKTATRLVGYLLKAFPEFGYEAIAQAQASGLVEIYQARKKSVKKRAKSKSKPKSKKQKRTKNGRFA